MKPVNNIAREIVAGNWVDQKVAGYLDFANFDGAKWNELETLIAAALESARNEAMEEAIGILKSLMNRSPVHRGLTIPEQCENEAIGSAINRIRSLKGSKVEGSGESR